MNAHTHAAVGILRDQVDECPLPTIPGLYEHPQTEFETNNIIGWMI